MIETIKGDILELGYTDLCYVIQQCNCLTVKPHGLSDTIAKKYTYANFYEQREGVGIRNLAIEKDRDIPGTIKIAHNGKNDSPYIVALFSQYDFGKVGKNYGTIKLHVFV
jgi:O-acetyl-ADP-ribose deacetylase (regulator of RNase III)